MANILLLLGWGTPAQRGLGFKGWQHESPVMKPLLISSSLAVEQKCMMAPFVIEVAYVCVLSSP